MAQRVVLLSNTCPFGGEVFLQNELKWIPQDQPVILYPIFAGDRGEQTVCRQSNIQVRRLAAGGTIRERLRAGWNSLRMLFAAGEYAAALKKPHSLRNLLKALKFGYISELKYQEIARDLKREADHENGFVLYSYWLYETAYIAARLKESFPASRLYSRCHGFDLYEIRHPNGYLPYRSYLMESADAVYPISDDGRDYIERLYAGKWSEKVQVMRLGTESWGMNPETKGEAPVIVSCSNMVEVKRIDRIIDALKESKHAVKWYHFGDGILRERLEREAQKLPPHVEWKLMGSVPNAELMQFYREHHIDVFLNVSASEGVPVSIMEALSFGIPAVATDVGGTHEIVVDKENGLLLPADFTGEELRERIALVCSGESGNMRAKAREIWEQRCSAERNYPSFYRRLSE